MKFEVLGKIRELGLGFVEKRERRRRREEERETFSRNEVNRVANPYIQASGPGCPIPGPFPFNDERWIKILMDPDQSNAPGALV